jgi:hypothetical protein
MARAFTRDRAPSSAVGCGRARARSEGAGRPSLKSPLGGRWGQKTVVAADAATSPAHHFRLLLGGEKGKFPENILEKAFAAVKSLEINCSRCFGSAGMSVFRADNWHAAVGQPR